MYSFFYRPLLVRGLTASPSLLFRVDGLQKTYYKLCAKNNDAKADVIFVDGYRDSTKLKQTFLCARRSRSCLHYCNIIYEYFPMILNSSHLRGEKGASKLAAIAVVSVGYGGDIDGELCNGL